jgi:2,3-dihydroxybenzoate decarboxylase
MAEKLNVPIYLHPGKMSPDMSQPYLTYPVLAGAMWGFAAEAGLHAMRLICSGIFDKYTGLKIILGHLGEGIPYWLWRIDNHWARYIARMTQTGFQDNKVQKKPGQYFADNFYVTTSGMYWQPALQLCHSALGADRILFAADYPPESSIEAVQSIASMPIEDSYKEMIYHLNAEKLLGL